MGVIQPLLEALNVYGWTHCVVDADLTQPAAQAVEKRGQAVLNYLTESFLWIVIQLEQLLDILCCLCGFQGNCNGLFNDELELVRTFVLASGPNWTGLHETVFDALLDFVEVLFPTGLVTLCLNVQEAEYRGLAVSSETSYNDEINRDSSALLKSFKYK